MALRGRIAPPPLSPPVINLVTSSRNPEPVDPDGKPLHWEQGFEFLPLPNQDPVLGSMCGSVDFDPSAVEQVVSCEPWWASIEDRCSSFGFGGHNFIGRVFAGLAAATPKAVEKEFWDGTVAQAEGNDNLYLAMAPVMSRDQGFGPIILNPTLGTAVGLVEAFELLEQALGNFAGARGMIHAAPLTTPNFLGVRREGNLLLTQRDTIVCSGSGYSGQGPSGATGATPTAIKSWLYATSIPITLLGDPFILGDGDTVQVPSRPIESTLPGTVPYGGPGDPGPLERLYTLDLGLRNDDRAITDYFQANFLDRDTNEIRARAFRPVAATWDGIVHYAVLTDITA